MLSRKHAELLAMMERLEGGLEKLKSTAAQVDDLKEKLAAQEVCMISNVRLLRAHLEHCKQNCCMITTTESVYTHKLKGCGGDYVVIMW